MFYNIEDETCPNCGGTIGEDGSCTCGLADMRDLE